MRYSPCPALAVAMYAEVTGIIREQDGLSFLFCYRRLVFSLPDFFKKLQEAGNPP
jgi:hypothetical protein